MAMQVKEDTPFEKKIKEAAYLKHIGNTFFKEQKY